MTLKPKTQTPAEWERETGIHVLDADGWRQAGKDYSEPVTLAEFGVLCGPSTIRVNASAVWG